MARLLVLIATIALAACGAQSPKCASTDARGVVDALQPRDQFRAMLKMTAKRTQTVAMAAYRDGAGASQKLDSALDKAVERHGAEWERNIVSSWATLSSPELQQVCTTINERDKSTYTRFSERLGPEVQSRNEPVLHRAAIEVLDAVWTGKR